MTIKEIAQVAGVSRGTVDRALHGREGVAPEVAERIRKVAREGGYTPNKAGRILAARKQPLKIGCLLPSVGNPFFDSVIKGMKTATKELADFGVEIQLTELRGYDPEEHIACMDALIEDGCTALCVCTVDVAQVRERIDMLVEQDIPIITLNTDITDSKRLCYVGSNYMSAGRTAAGMFRLCTKAPLRILLVTGSRKMKGHNERILGFLARMDTHKIDYEIVETIESQDDDAIAYTQVLKALSQDESINCVYIVAAGVEGTCRAIQELGRKKSGEFWLSAFDQIPATKQLLENGIIDFTISQQGEMQGYQSIQIMFNYVLEGKKERPDNYFTSTVIKIAENIQDNITGLRK